MLLERLQEYDRSDIYPFHMPGHKRQMDLGADAYHLDITEVEGFDNLHHAQGILKEEQARLARYVGADQSFFSRKWQYLRDSGSHLSCRSEGRKASHGAQLS